MSLSARRSVRLDAPNIIHARTRWAKTHPTVLFVLALIVTLGCHSEKPNAQPKPQPTGPVQKVGNSETLAKLVEQHQGKVILIDFWATWCVECVEKIPEIVTLSRRFPDDLVVIAVSFDDPSQLDAAVKYLEKQDVPFDLIVSEAGAGTASAEDFDIPGDLPFYRLLDRDGKLHAQFYADLSSIEKGYPLEELEPRVSELVNEN